MEKAKIIGNVGSIELQYGAHHYHRMLNDDMNIGELGEHLTIMVLTCNRSNSTIELIKSIETHFNYFKGTLLIVDNGSTKSELKELKEYLKKVSFKHEIIELGKNYGVAGGRNKGVSHVKTEWFMSLDNDIYFTADPIFEIRTTISLLGCHFLNLPLLEESENKIFVNGGNIFLYNAYNSDTNNQDIHFGGGSLFECIDVKKNQKYNPSLGTFLFGGASVLKTKTFIDTGMFDENMFVGFEDYDYSIELFQRGYKIGNLGYVCFVHNHKMPLKTDDKEYEKIRFSNDKLRESGLYFEKKRGFKVWNKETENWIKEKHKKLNI